MIKSYGELSKLGTFKDRFLYLQLEGSVGISTFGFDRYINQQFYRSKEWKHVRNQVIVRDNGCDLGIEGYEIYGRVYIHHMNPLLVKDIQRNSDFLLNPEYLITVSFDTHNAIHYGNEDYLSRLVPVERVMNDTCPWKK